MTDKERAQSPVQAAPQAKNTKRNSSIPFVYCFVDDIIACGENGGMSACHLDEETFIGAMLQWREAKQAEYRAQEAYWEFRNRLMRGEACK